MQTFLKFIPIEVIFAFLANYLTNSIKNPTSARARDLKPLVENVRTLADKLLEKLNTPVE